MDEIFGLPGVDDDTIGDIWLKAWTAIGTSDRAEMEGLSKIDGDGFIEKAKKSDGQFRTLAEYAEECRPDKCEIMGTLTGRAGALAVQRRMKMDR